MRFRNTLAVTAALSSALLLAGCTTPAGGMSGMDEMGSSAPTSSSSTDHNSADVMFAQMMIPHHAQAVEMADMILAKSGIDDRVVRIAERIKQAQAPEIDQMNGFLRSYGQPEVDPSSDMSGMHDMQMDGMMSDADMQELEQATGGAAAKLFLSQMVEHHTGAIAMAESEITDGRDPAATELAKTIVSDQKTEISEMQALLKEL